METRRASLCIAAIVSGWLLGCTHDVEPDPPEKLPATGEIARELDETQTRSLWARIANDELEITLHGDAYHAVNRRNDLRVWFRPDGAFEVVPRQDATRQVSLRLAGWGREGSLTVPTLEERRQGSCMDERRLNTAGRCSPRLEHLWNGGIVEWFDNRPEGVEHGFDLPERADRIFQAGFDPRGRVRGRLSELDGEASANLAMWMLVA